MMKLMRALIAAPLALLAACGPGEAPDPARPESYARQWPVEPAAGAPQQRLALPPAVLLTLKTTDLADLRLFDGTGRTLPLARLDGAEQASRTVTVPSYPVMASGAPAEAGVALTIGPDKVARVVGIAGDPGGERQVALLVDSRTVAGPVLALRLEADLPVRQPVTLRASASSDLKTWEPLGEKTLFRTDAAGGQLEPALLHLGGVALKDRYVQVTWDRAAPARISAASLVEALGPASPGLTVATTGARLENPRDLRFTLPAGPWPDALDVTLADSEGVLPVQLFARAHAEQGWQLLSTATLRSGAAPGANRLPLAGAPGREFRLVTDARTAGFAAVPAIALHYGEVTLLTRFSGQPPYTLAAGLTPARPGLLTAGDIVPQGDAGKLPLAQVSAQAPVPVSIAPAGDTGPFGGRKAVLWAILLIGVAVLALAVVRLLRKGAGTGSGTGRAEGEA